MSTNREITITINGTRVAAVPIRITYSIKDGHRLAYYDLVEGKEKLVSLIGVSFLEETKTLDELLDDEAAAQRAERETREPLDKLDPPA